MRFVAKLRELSGGKPVGFKLCIGHAWEWFAIAKAMLKTGITPDFIVKDGAEGGTGDAPIAFVDHAGTTLRDGLRLVHHTQVAIGLREQQQLGVSRNILTHFEVEGACAFGATYCTRAHG